MKKLKSILLLCLFLSSTAVMAMSKPKEILIFSYTKKYRHQSIETGIAALTKIAEEKGYAISATEKPEDINDKNLKRFKAIVFLNPTGSNVFNEAQKAAFQKFINKGGGFVGIHAATDFCYEWEWYGKLVGAYFTSHPKVQQADLHIKDNSHPSTKGLPEIWKHTDEWYNFKDFNPNVKVLITADEKSYQGGKMPDFHPVSWYHDYDGGRVFYTALGHTKECYTDDLFLKHISGGLDYVLSKK